MASSSKGGVSDAKAREKTGHGLEHWFDVIKALTDKRVRTRWVKGVDARLVKALSAAVDSPASKGIVVRPDGQGRFRYKWGDTIVQLYLLPKPGGKVFSRSK